MDRWKALGDTEATRLDNLDRYGGLCGLRTIRTRNKSRGRNFYKRRRGKGFKYYNNIVCHNEMGGGLNNTIGHMDWERIDHLDETLDMDITLESVIDPDMSIIENMAGNELSFLEFSLAGSCNQEEEEEGLEGNVISINDSNASQEGNNNMGPWDNDVECSITSTEAGNKERNTCREGELGDNQDFICGHKNIGSGDIIWKPCGRSLGMTCKTAIDWLNNNKKLDTRSKGIFFENDMSTELLNENDDLQNMMEKGDKYCSLDDIEERRTDSLVLMQMNARSVANKQDDIDLFIDDLDKRNNKPDVIAISEVYNPEGFFHKDYKMVTYTRGKCNGGGCGMLVSKNLTFRELNTKTKPKERSFEFKVIITERKGKGDTRGKGVKKDAIISIYHPPTAGRSTKGKRKKGEEVVSTVKEVEKELNGAEKHFNEFMERLSELLDEIIQMGLNRIHLLGDFNINPLDSKCGRAAALVSTLLGFGLVLVNRKATFFERKEPSLLDMIFTTEINEIVGCRTITEEIADHCEVMVEIVTKDLGGGKENEVIRPREMFCRKFNEDRIKDFVEDIKNKNFNDVMNEEDVNRATDKFYDKFFESFNKHFPIDIKKVHKNKNIFPVKAWMTKRLLDLRRIKKRLAVKFKKNRERFGARYRKARAEYKKEITKAKAEWNRQRLIGASNNMKAYWKVLQDIYKKKDAREVIGSIRSRDGKILTDDKDKARAFNEYLNTFSEDIIENIPKFPGRSYKEFMNEPTEHSFRIKEVTEDKILQALKRFKPKKTQDFRGMSIFLLKKVSLDIAPVLTDIFNKAIRDNTFPDKFKDCVISPIFKKGDKQEMANYRGITLGDSFGKCFEKVISQDLMDYLIDNKLVYEKQFGFLRETSTSHCMLSMMDVISEKLNDRKLVGCVGLDVQKAFDTVDHSILFDKLENIGIRGGTLDFFKSYYTNRRQYSKINGVMTDDYVTIPRSVLQGTVLGVIGFLIFINDLKNVTKYADNFIFADDLNSLYAANSHEELEKMINEDVEELMVYYSVNKLSVHPQKSTIILFKNKGDRNRYRMKEGESGEMLYDLRCYINGADLRVVNNDREDNTVKILGILFDENLNFEQHAQSLYSKLASGTFLISRARKFLNNDEMFMLYHAFFRSHMNYSLPFLGNCNMKTIEGIHKLDKRVLRVADNKGYRAHSIPIFRDRNILPIKENMELFAMRFMHKVCHRKQPEWVNDLWEKAHVLRNRTCNDRNMRNYNEVDFVIKNANRKDIDRHPRYNFPRLFNKLDLELKQEEDVDIFLRKSRNLLMERLHG